MMMVWLDLGRSAGQDRTRVAQICRAQVDAASEVSRDPFKIAARVRRVQ